MILAIWLRLDRMKQKNICVDQPCSGRTKYGGITLVDNGRQLERKIKLMKIYKSEIDEFPFPQNDRAFRALAHLCGSQAGFEAQKRLCCCGRNFN